MDRQAFK
jgi:hypothetical protein